MGNCCGPAICTDFESFFCQTLKLLPKGNLDPEGDYIKFLRAIARAFYDIFYDSPTGLCSFLDESDVLTSEVALECWQAVYQVSPEIPCVLGGDCAPDWYKSFLAAYMRSVELVTFYDGTKFDLLHQIADFFGLTINIYTPSLMKRPECPRPEGTNCSTGFVMDFDTEPKVCDEYADLSSVSRSFLPVKAMQKKLGIEIVASPAPFYIALHEFRLGEPICCDIWISGFQSVVRQYFPIGLKFCDISDKNPPNPAPVFA